MGENSISNLQLGINSGSPNNEITSANNFSNALHTFKNNNNPTGVAKRIVIQNQQQN